ncbi:MAG TPA: hypothetical protein VGV36_03745 [Solirubrobacteraceae bacterium]|nr:hypothetical protein [Solirubrobacteraceae bacterium]
MDAWVLFLVAAALLAAGQVLTLSFFLAPFAVGALAGMVADRARRGQEPS